EYGYVDRIGEMMAKALNRVLISLDELRDYNEDLCRDLMLRPFEHIPALETALREIVIDRDPAYMARLATGGEDGDKELRRSALDKAARIHAGFVGSFGAALVSPRSLSARLITRLVCVEGIVTRCTAVRPKVARSVHFNPADKEFLAREYRDATDPYGLPTGSVYPTKTDDGKPLQTEFGLSTYRDHQTITVQEMPERAPLGQLPRSVDIILDGDLVDIVKPGDRVGVSGVFRALAGRVTSGGSGKFRTA
ncbi:ROA2, partial [Symbiodinium sp. KB8]